MEPIRTMGLAHLAIVAGAVFASTAIHAQATPPDNCPFIGWAEGLPGLQKPGAPFPTQDTRNTPTPDCAFHQWSWEAFVWATALDADGLPRFMSLPTLGDLLDPSPQAGGARPRQLKLGLRPFQAHDTPGVSEQAGAIVEADGNMLVSPNGYPVYASVHMNPAYFSVAKRNLIINGGYQKQPADDFFAVGAAVFKATWMRLDPGQKAPAGAFTTQAEVPVLTVYRTKNTLTVAASKQTTQATVVLVGLHVVGYTVNHPEFLWGTFEHKDNTPSFADNTFDPSSTASDPKSYTFYAGGTPWNHVNYNQGNQAAPFLLKFDLASQKFTTVTVPNNDAAGNYNGTSASTSPGGNSVLADRTGSETNSPSGPANIAALNQAAQNELAHEKAPQSAFSSYGLVGTVWMAPGSYTLTSNNTNAVGSVNLANTTAETFFQVQKIEPSNATPSQTGNTMLNCFLCHNATSYNFQSNLPKLPSRLIALSHVLAVGSPYSVPNVMPVLVPTSQGAPAREAPATEVAPQPRRK